MSVANLHEKILDVDRHFDLFFCPCLLDTKKKDIESMPDAGIALTLFNGAIKTEENEEMAHLLRKKSKVLVAYGSCAIGGCIPALSNLHNISELYRRVYLENPSIDNPDRILPQCETDMPEGKITIPGIYDSVRTLSQIVDVDYYIPGCPPESNQLWNVIELIINGGKLPEKGLVIGAGTKNVCEECEKKKNEKKIDRFYRIYEIIPDPEKCLLEQGIVCMGPATRDGCGGLCPRVNMPCIGCYGAPEGVLDQGAVMIGALGGVLNIDRIKALAEDKIPGAVDEIIKTMPDMTGVFYKFSLSGSILKKAIK